MGAGLSRTSSGHSRRPTIRSTVSSFLACSIASVEDYPNELLVNSAEHCHQKKLKSPRKNSNQPLGNGKDLISINTESMVSSGRHFSSNENHTSNACLQENVGHENKGKCLSDNRQSVTPHQSTDNAGGNDTASTSYLCHPSCNVSTNEISDMDSMNGVNCKIGDSLQIDKELTKSSTANSPCHGVPLLDEVSVENNVSDEVDFSNSDLSSSSFVSGSSFDYPLVREDSLQEVTHSGLGFLESDMEQNRQDGCLLQIDMLSLSSNVLPSNSAEISAPEARRSSRRLFWNAFTRRGSRNHTESRISALSLGGSGPLMPHDNFHDISGGSPNVDFGGNSSSHGNRTSDSDEQHENSRPETWERLPGTLDSTHRRTAVCPRGIHGNASCSCSSSSEVIGTRSGISRIVMLAEALFEVLDQIHQQPTSLSLSVVSLPAPGSVVDSFPLKTHTKVERLESAEDVSQCYICLSEYVEGDRIRVLPCHHEFHMACVDKWLKEIHSVCPLCRKDVGKGST